MRIILLLITVMSLIALSSCATTSYVQQKNDWLGRKTIGYYDTKIQDGLFKVGYLGSSADSVETVEDYAMIRAAEVTLDNGYSYFLIDSTRYVNNQNSSYTPLSSYQYKGNTYFMGGYSTVTTLPEFYFTIKCYHNEPYDDEKIVYDAAELRSNLMQKHDIKDCDEDGGKCEEGSDKGNIEGNTVQVKSKRSEDVVKQQKKVGVATKEEHTEIKVAGESVLNEMFDSITD